MVKRHCREPAQTFRSRRHPTNPFGKLFLMRLLRGGLVARRETTTGFCPRNRKR